jgi:DtxR family transcriptional regulator, Mn-dependent transcriptional regulator
MYLKAIWFIREKGEEVRVSSIARLLNIKQPSVVSMLHKLDEADLVRYKAERIVDVTPKGEK